MSLIDREKLIYEAETCRETTDAFIELTRKQPNASVRINLNEVVKFKLTDFGKDIFYHQFDSVNEYVRKHGGKQQLIKPRMPEIDEAGYTRMQLWSFMELYGSYFSMTEPNVIEPLEIIYEVS